MTTRDALFTCALLLVGCGEVTPTNVGNEDNVVSIDSSDPLMNKAISKAKASFGFFKENWQTFEADSIGLKFGLKTKDNGLEHIWFTPSSIDGTKIIAECANDPVGIPNLKLGDVRIIDEKHHSDWMLIVGNKCYGGYTIQAALAEHPSPESVPQLEFIEP